MKRIERIDPLRVQIADWRRRGARIALVPTMGNLHRGHLALVDAARAQAERVVATVFVNPLQFGPGEDFARYPRTLDEDAAALRARGCDLLFAPPKAEVYPRGRAGQTWVEVPGLSGDLCGASRPGHFRGVATVVAKLFGMVQPDLAVFGEKDLQQLLVIRRMAADLNLPVGILGVPTVREPDGLALSSRNAYLAPEERARAPRLYATLQVAAEALRAGTPPAAAEAEAEAALRAAGFVPDYVRVRRAADLLPPPADSPARALVVLAAARLGRARLIDNLAVEPPGPDPLHPRPRT